MERFWNKVNKLGFNDCWNWIGGSRGMGYGAFKINNKVIDSHRMSWILKNGEIEKGLYVLHTCDNRKCINPNHLFLGTHSDNMKDCANKKRLYSQSNVGKKKLSEIKKLKYSRKIINKENTIFNCMADCSIYYKFSESYLYRLLLNKNNKLGLKYL